MKERTSLWIVSLGALAVATALMVVARARLNAADVALAYLIIVQVASSRGGRVLGLAVAITAFFTFNWFFLAPYGTLALANPMDWFVLLAFLVTSIIAAELLYRARALGAERMRGAAEAERVKTLEASNYSKDAILASVSHDLRTPLTTIKGLAHEIADAGDERAEIIEEEADRLNTFVGKLLELSRLEMGAAALDIQPNEAEDLLGAAAQQIQGRLDGRPLAIHVEPSATLLFGRFDFVQTLRILMNLLDNAVKYSPPGASVDVHARRAGDRLEFSVADRGRGVPDDERERIFEPFYRTTNNGSVRSGTGLGLTIARGLARVQGGDVTVTSREGGGSVFTLVVPAIDLSTQVSA